jgi:RNA methyltransferase, TrmH family
MRITSVQNQRVKDAIRLRDRKGREEQQRIVIDGAREIQRAFQAGVQILELFADKSSTADSEQEIIETMERVGAEIHDVSPRVMQKLAYGDRASGLVAVARAPRKQLLDQLVLASDAIVVVLEHVEKPGNLGAVARTADAARIAAVITADSGTDIYNPNAIRASAGTIFGLPVICTTALEALAWLRAQQFRIYATRVDGSEPYWRAKFTGRAALVLGSEVSGLTPIWSGKDVKTITLPQYGIADSLNVSVTAAVLFYEALRQRETTPR